MQKWIISANGKIYNHAAAFAKYGYIDWAQRAKYQVGDEVYIYCSKPHQKIMYKTVVIKTSIPFDNITDDSEFWFNEEKYRNASSGIYARLKLICQTDNENLSLEKLLKHGMKAAPQGPLRVKQELAEYIDCFLNANTFIDFLDEFELPQECYEGAKYSIVVNKYERSSVARSKCIEKYGCKCVVCGMDFEKRYGEIGKGFIHIHHVVPISTIGENYKVDYEKDLIPVCPNCHAMLHRGKNGELISVEDLKEILKTVEERTKISYT